MMKKYDIDSICGSKNEMLFFYGHHKKNTIDKSCFSQWYDSPFTVNGLEYATAEHWMMAEKARLFKDEDALVRIFRSRNPYDAKMIGKTVRNFNQTIWDANCMDIVIQGNIYKFEQNVDILEFLLGTGNKILVEASPYDAIWGIKMRIDDPNRFDVTKWKGTNKLGFALMSVRDYLNSN